MIQDIYPKVLKNEYDKDAVAADGDKVFAVRNSEVLVGRNADGEIIFPTVAECGKDKKYRYLFAVDEERYFLAEEEISGSENYEYVEFRKLREISSGPRDRMYAAYTAKHLSDWYRDNHYCGRCGAPMKHSEKERAMHCDKCGYTSYPRIMPAVIVGVLNQDKILLTKYRTGFQHFALIAGFTEIGETVEETVSREVMEEAGLKVKNIRYYKSQPWGSANDILLGFFCEVDGDSTIKMDADELKYAEWVTRENVILQPDDFSLTNEMMKLFKDGLI